MIKFISRSIQNKERIDTTLKNLARQTFFMKEAVANITSFKGGKVI